MKRKLWFLTICLATHSLLAENAMLLQPLSTEEDVVRPLPLGFSSRSLLPWFGPDEPPALLVANHGKYYPERSLLFRADGKDGSGKPFALPADYPLYRGMPFDKAQSGGGAVLPGARYFPLVREDGLFDLIHLGNLQFYRNTGRVGAPRFVADYKVTTAEPLKGNSHWIEDLDGDGIPDLLSGGLEDDKLKFFQFPDWPQEKGPWSGKEHPNMGSLPDTDIQNFRGYDIAGNWMGMPIRKYLWWAKGSRDDQGRLGFGEYRPVRYGETDYPVQWQGFGRQLSPAVMHLENGTFIVVFSGPDEVLALPLRGGKDGELRTGKAIPFLKNGNRRLQSVNLPTVIGVGDLNQDGHDELVVGSGANGRFSVLAGTRAGEFEELGNVFSKGGPVSGDTLAVPARADWDGDGNPDIILGDASGYLSFWKGTRDPLLYGSCDFFQTDAGVVRHRPRDGNLQGEEEAAWSYTQPEVFDWDGDGLMDIITNDNEAKLFLYRGTGKGTLLKSPERFMLGDKPLPLAWRSRPSVIEAKHGLAGPDRNVLLFMTWDGKLAYAIPSKPGSIDFKNVVDLSYADGRPIRLGGPAGLSGRIKFTAADWDGDGVWDVVMGVQKSVQKYLGGSAQEAPSAAPYWLRNVGTNAQPKFEEARLITFKSGLPIEMEKHSFDVFPTDLNKDGQLDIIFGDDEGTIFHLMRDALSWDNAPQQAASGKNDP